MSPIIQEAIDNKPFILQILDNIKSGKRGNDCLQGTGYLVTDSHIPAKEFLKHVFNIYSHHPQSWGWSNIYIALGVLEQSLETIL